MNCNLCRQQLDAYREGKLTGDTRARIKSHLENCKSCEAVYRMENLVDKAIHDEKGMQVNPFLVTRVMSRIEELERHPVEKVFVPAYRKVLKPVLISLSVAAGMAMGILAGNIYQPVPSSEKIPVEMAYMNDAAIESVDFLAN